MLLQEFGYKECFCKCRIYTFQIFCDSFSIIALHRFFKLLDKINISSELINLRSVQYKSQKIRNVSNTYINKSYICKIFFRVPILQKQFHIIQNMNVNKKKLSKKKILNSMETLYRFKYILELESHNLKANLKDNLLSQKIQVCYQFKFQ